MTRSSDPQRDWAALPPDALLAHVESTHHFFLRSNLPRLSVLGRRVVEQHGHRFRELDLVLDVYEELRLDLGPHLVKEERVLFPLVRELARASRLPSFDCGSIANPIAAMLADHGRTTLALGELRVATNGYAVPDEASADHRTFYEGLAAIDADTELHLHLENDVLFPAAIALEAALPR